MIQQQFDDILTNQLITPKIPTGLSEIVSTFGDLSLYINDDGVIDNQEASEFLTTMTLPFTMFYAYDHSITIRRMTCHKLIAPIFLEVFQIFADLGLDAHLLEYGGCYNYRSKRTNNKLSTHSWGIAVDLNPRSNQMGSRGDMHPDVVKIFTDYGFVWGGHWNYPDPMHFQYARKY